MNLRQFENIKAPPGSTGKMPVLFLGHGSPMNAIEENEFVTGFRKLGSELPRPSAILCVSAHWETNGTQLTAMEKPQTIHDFGGFPRKLFEVQYPAPGDPELVKTINDNIPSATPNLKWGLDHGAWTVLRHMYPEADIPVVQMSIDFNKAPLAHYELGRELSFLRSKGVLVAGSGNMVHNLGLVAWDRLDDDEYAYEWAAEASDKLKNYILSGDSRKLIDYSSLGRSVQLSVPTPEHYLPLLYALSLRENDEPVKLFNDRLIAGSLSMTSVIIGG